MKRFHVNVAVTDIAKSVDFYRTLFGAEPTVQKEDYAKWMLEDPRINFSINQSLRMRGINHVGLQADTMAELGQIQDRLQAAGERMFEQVDAECCYAKSDKTWVRDPDDVAWETFVTHGQITHYGDDLEPESPTAVTTAKRCCE
jgi:catechol 2,3-dioxygenase-like lactoylglutathione lyase family enzyme